MPGSVCNANGRGLDRSEARVPVESLVHWDALLKDLRNPERETGDETTEIQFLVDGEHHPTLF